jgi:O-antigen/teichoic acid export membrane protein
MPQLARVRKPKQSAGRRLTTITIDQAIAGASNVLTAVLAARLLGVASFGLFGIVFLVYVLVQGVNRALVCDPSLVHAVEAQERPGEVIGTSCVLGVALAACVLVAGFGAELWDPSLGNALLVLAVCIPLLVLQDLGRYLAFASGRPTSAVVLDVAWLVFLFAAVAALVATETRRTLAWFIAAWAGSGAAAGLLLFSQYRGREVPMSLSWLRYTWQFSWRYLISYTSTQGAALGASSGVGGIAGARALGGLQGALLLVRPFMTFQVAAIAASIGEISRSLVGNQRLRRHVARTSALTSVVALLNVLAMLVLPDRLGETVLGASWHAAQPLLLPTGVQIVCIGLLTGVRAGLLGTRAIRKVMVIDVASTVAILLSTVSGAVIDGVVGALWAVALCQGLMAVVWWMTFWMHTSRAQPAASAAVLSPLPPATAPR